MDDRSYEIYEDTEQRKVIQAMQFEAGSKFGKCVILQQTKDKSYSLIYSLQVNEFIVVDGLNTEKGNWFNGSYFGSNLNGALKHFNVRNNVVNKKIKEMEER